MKNSLPTNPLSAGELKTLLRQNMRFTLRTCVIVILLAATAGLTAHTVLGVVKENRKNALRENGINKVKDLGDLRYGIYEEVVKDWYAEAAGSEFVTREELDLVMRLAERQQNPEAVLKELEHLPGARREGDTFQVYSVRAPEGADQYTRTHSRTKGNTISSITIIPREASVPTGTTESTPVLAEKPAIATPSDQYALLVRDGLVVFFAERKINDARWVERSVDYSKFESFYNTLNLVVIPGAMFMVVFSFFGLCVLVGLFRHLSTPPPSLAAGYKKPAEN